MGAYKKIYQGLEEEEKKTEEICFPDIWHGQQFYGEI